MNGFLSKCELCPRCCGVDRSAGALGYCKAGSTAEVYRSGPHFGEEPPLTGVRGSGTVFFSRCTLRCGYCQNYPWSQNGKGAASDVQALSRLLVKLAQQGCHNWNLVSPTPWLPMIRAAMEEAERSGFSLPVVYNTSGFERVEILAEFEDVANIFLTDLRYARPESAAEGSGWAGYVVAARSALLQMWRQAGPLTLDANGVAVSGVICRLLVLPGRSREAVENLRWLADAVGTGIAVSIMSQYLPVHEAGAGRMGSPWNRRINRREYEEVAQAMEAIGFRSGWMQDFDAETPRELIGCEMTSQEESTG